VGICSLGVRYDSINVYLTFLYLLLELSSFLVLVYLFFLQFSTEKKTSKFIVGVLTNAGIQEEEVVGS
jgi:hypothetical protein